MLFLLAQTLMGIFVVHAYSVCEGYLNRMGKCVPAKTIGDSYRQARWYHGMVKPWLAQNAVSRERKEGERERENNPFFRTVQHRSALKCDRKKKNVVLFCHAIRLESQEREKASLHNIVLHACVSERFLSGKYAHE